MKTPREYLQESTGRSDKQMGDDWVLYTDQLVTHLENYHKEASREESQQKAKERYDKAMRYSKDDWDGISSRNMIIHEIASIASGIESDES